MSRKHIPLPVTEIAAKYLSGMSTNDLSIEYGVSSIVIRNRLLGLGVKFRERGQIGKYEDVLYSDLVSLGLNPERQSTIGGYVPDLKLGNVVVEMWTHCNDPYNNKHQRKKIDYYLNQGLSVIYVWISDKRKEVYDFSIAQSVFDLTNHVPASGYFMIRGYR